MCSRYFSLHKPHFLIEILLYVKLLFVFALPASFYTSSVSLPFCDLPSLPYSPHFAYWLAFIFFSPHPVELFWNFLALYSSFSLPALFLHSAPTVNIPS